MACPETDKSRGIAEDNRCRDSRSLTSSRRGLVADATKPTPEKADQSTGRQEREGNGLVIMATAPGRAHNMGKILMEARYPDAAWANKKEALGENPQAQVCQFLEEHDQIGLLAIFSHGAPGAIRFGSLRSSTSLPEVVSAWQKQMKRRPRIHEIRFEGCNVGKKAEEALAAFGSFFEADTVRAWDRRHCICRLTWTQPLEDKYAKEEYKEFLLPVNQRPQSPGKERSRASQKYLWLEFFVDEGVMPRVDNDTLSDDHDPIPDNSTGGFHSRQWMVPITVNPSRIKTKNDIMDWLSPPRQPVRP